MELDITCRIEAKTKELEQWGDMFRQFLLDMVPNVLGEGGNASTCPKPSITQRDGNTCANHQNRPVGNNSNETQR